MRKIKIRMTFIMLVHCLDVFAFAADNTAGNAERSPQSEASHDVTGVCIKVVDGDTIDVRLDGKVVRFRLHGADAPEKGQPFSKKAASFVHDRIAGGTVGIKYTRGGKAAWKRSEGVVYFGDGRCLNRELVAAGLAVVDARYCEDEYMREWAEEEARAKELRLGFWSLKNPVPPWEKRELDRRGDAEARAKREAVTAPYLANGKRRVFHATTCQGSFAKNCTIPFATREAAAEAGFRPCKRCTP